MGIAAKLKLLPLRSQGEGRIGCGYSCWFLENGEIGIVKRCWLFSRVCFSEWWGNGTRVKLYHFNWRKVGVILQLFANWSNWKRNERKRGVFLIAKRDRWEWEIEVSCEIGQGKGRDE